MATLVARSGVFCYGVGFGRGWAKSAVIVTRLPNTAGQQVATMKATYGEKYPYKKPWPYQTKKYTYWHETFYENTIHRFNENTKVIVVDGNIGVGKNAFAKKLAKMFDLQYFPSVTDKPCFHDNLTGFDERDLDPILPSSCQSYDLTKFLAEKHPENGRVALLQRKWYKEKTYAYCDALVHLLSTGQGVVVVRSPFSDYVFVEAMKKMGYVTPEFMKYYYYVYNNTICELMRPHISIYLDAPTKVLRDRIRKRGDQRELNSKVLSDKYLDTLSQVYRENFLTKMGQTCEVIEIDATEEPDDLDVAVVAEEIEKMVLESADCDDPKFQDWNESQPDDCLGVLRRTYANREHFNALFTLPEPFEAPEAMYSLEDHTTRRAVFEDHPALKYRQGWAPELGYKGAWRF